MELATSTLPLDAITLAFTSDAVGGRRVRRIVPARSRRRGEGADQAPVDRRGAGADEHRDRAVGPGDDAQPSDEKTGAAPDQAASRTIIISDDLPLTLFVAVATAVIMSALNAVPQMIFVGVVLAPLISDLLKNEVKHRGWGKRRLVALTGLLSMGGTTRELMRERGKDARASASSAEGPSLAGVCVTAVASSVAVIVLVTVVEQARERALLADRSSTFFSASTSRDDARGALGFSTPEAAIMAFARTENWAARGRNYEGDCEDVVKGRPRRLFCSTDWGRSTAYLRARLAPGERAFFIGPGWSDAYEVSLVLGHEDGRWSVRRVLVDVRPR